MRKEKTKKNDSVSVEMLCYGCGNSQKVEVVFEEKQKVRTVHWMCSRCGESKKMMLTRLEDDQKQ